MNEIIEFAFCPNARILPVAPSVSLVGVRAMLRVFLLATRVPFLARRHAFVPKRRMPFVSLLTLLLVLLV